MRASQNIEQDFMSTTCLEHPGVLPVATCINESCLSNRPLCTQCIKTAHAGHITIPLKEYHKIVSEAIFNSEELLE